MADGPKQRVEVEFEAKGLSRLKSSWADFAGDLLEPVAILATGGTKAQAVWAGFRGIFESRVLGPLGLVAGATTGFLITTKKLIGHWREFGMESAGAIERLTIQFRPLLGNMERARDRAKELVEFTAKTPWRLEESAEANKLLEGLTRGALSTKDGMMLVGDAAAVAGAGFAETARQVGRLYDGLMSGRPVGESSMRLQELGLISGTTRNQIEALQAANASGMETWRLVERELLRNKGAQDALSESLEGLKSTYEDTKSQLQAGFSSGFLDGEKAGIKSATKLMEALTPVAADVGKEIGRVENSWAGMKLRVVESVTSWKGFGAAVEWGGKALVGLAAVITGTAGAAVGAFIVKLLRLAVSQKAAADSAMYQKAVMESQIPVMTKLKSAKDSLIAAQRAHAAGLKAEASAQLNAAGAGLKNIATTNGFIGVTKAARMGLTGMGMAARFVGAQMKAMIAGMLANPVFWVLAAVSALSMGLSKLAENQRKAKEEQEAYEKATTALSGKLGQDIREVRSLVDQRRVEAQVIRELAQAYSELEQSKTHDRREAAKGKIGMLQERLAEVRAPKYLERSDEEMEASQRRREREREAARLRAEAKAGTGPEQELERAIQAERELAEARQAAVDAGEEEIRVQRAREQAQRAAADAASEENALLIQRGKLEAKIAAGREAIADDPYVDVAKMNALVEADKAVLAQVNAKLAEIEARRNNAGDLQVGLASSSETEQLKAKIALSDSLEQARSTVDAKKQQLGEESDEKRRQALEAELELLKASEKAQEALADEAGVSGWDGGHRKDARARIEEIKANRAEALDPVKEQEAAERRKDAELAIVRARLDAEAQVAALRMEGFDRERMILDIERQKLEAQREAGRIGEQEYARQMGLLKAKGEAANRESMQRAKAITYAYESSRLERLAEEARRDGNVVREKHLRAEADAREDEENRRQAIESLKEVNASAERKAAAVEAMVSEKRAARDADRRRRDEEEAAGRDRVRANQFTAQAALEERILKLQGKTKEAKAVKENAARKQDELDRAELRRKFLEEGFGKEEAERLANRQVKQSQADRLMEALGSGRSTIVASSLAQIGGGGNVYGNPRREEDLLEKIRQILQQIRDDGRDNLMN